DAAAAVDGDAAGAGPGGLAGVAQGALREELGAVAADVQPAGGADLDGAGAAESAVGPVEGAGDGQGAGAAEAAALDVEILRGHGAGDGDDAAGEPHVAGQAGPGVQRVAGAEEADDGLGARGVVGAGALAAAAELHGAVLHVQGAAVDEGDLDERR